MLSLACIIIFAGQTTPAWAILVSIMFDVSLALFVSLRRHF